MFYATRKEDLKAYLKDNCRDNGEAISLQCEVKLGRRSLPDAVERIYREALKLPRFKVPIDIIVNANNVANLTFVNVDFGDFSLRSDIYPDLVFINCTFKNFEILHKGKLSASVIYNCTCERFQVCDSALRFCRFSKFVINGNIYMSDSKMSGIDWSGSPEHTDPIDYLANNFERCDHGYIVYKTFGEVYPSPAHWVLLPGLVVTEHVHRDRGEPCGCGVNVGTLDWIRRNSECRIASSRVALWKCLIRWEWLAGVVIPYNTDGKIRASRVELIEEVKI